MIGRGLSERRALAVVRMSASAYRYQPAPDRNADLRERILALAQRYKRYGVGMIHLKLRQAGVVVNYKRVERLYQEAMQASQMKDQFLATISHELRTPLTSILGWSEMLASGRLADLFGVPGATIGGRR